jgi:hypothetical protein
VKGIFATRRLALFIGLGLAACMADLPTEPSGEGAGLQMALPPVPAPPEELTGDLTGADGFGGLIELGVYEAPVLSRITVTGLLSYQGTGSGYLAGSGQIDAAGFFIPNQCSLIVKVRQVNASGGQVVGGPVNCPSQPTQQGSYENYAVVNGVVSAYQTAGPPGSCWKTAPPCITITGSRSVTVEPLDADLATPVGEIRRLITEMGDRTLSVVIGSRVQLMGHEMERTPVRHYLGRIFATAASLV